VQVGPALLEQVQQHLVDRDLGLALSPGGPVLPWWVPPGIREIDRGRIQFVPYRAQKPDGSGEEYRVRTQMWSLARHDWLDIDPSHQASAGITPVEFKIRTDDHAKTAADLTDRIIQSAGYSPRSLGLGAGAAATATEVRSDETQTLHTTGGH
jgi:hypothetical protein